MQLLFITIVACLALGVSSSNTTTVPIQDVQNITVEAVEDGNAMSEAEQNMWLRLLSAVEKLGKPQASCPEGFFEWESSCYHISTFSASRDEAIKFCSLYKGDLVTVESEEEHYRLLWEFQSHAKQYIYCPTRRYKIKGQDLLDIYWTGAESSQWEPWMWISNAHESVMTMNFWSPDIDPRNRTYEYYDRTFASTGIVKVLQSSKLSLLSHGTLLTSRATKDYKVDRAVNNHCLVYGSLTTPQEFEWFSVPCQHNAEFRFICEAPKGLTPVGSTPVEADVVEQPEPTKIPTTKVPTTKAPSTRRPTPPRYVTPSPRVPVKKETAPPPVVDIFGDKDSLLHAYYKNIAK